ncbi:MAG: EAL domain-containing protein [Acidihalobacter sp.]|uniref:putative bifunctional diguanylate cyclase/phosphodiesterase n=1 Tax=Acidihalobacter sp. TaxID=1872108 RepID=UPI00307D3F77
MAVTYGGAFRSRVAQRLFWKIVLVALLPVALMAGYSYFTVYRMLDSGAKAKAEHASKQFGLAVIDRLNLQARLLHDAAKVYPVHADWPWGLLGDLQGVSAAPDADALRRLNAGAVVLRFGAGTPPRLLLLVRQPTTQRILRTELDAQQLWHNDMTPNHVCIFTRDRRLLYCSSGMSPKAVVSALTLRADHETGSFEFEQGGEHFLAGYWAVGLRGVLGNRGLIIVTAERRREAIGMLVAFKQFYIALAFLALGLAAWVAVTQIRRQLSPLTDLMDSARNLAAGDFGVRAKAGGDDEFGQVANAFNRMADALGDKFYVQEAFARLDRAVLEAVDVAGVARVLVEYLPKVAGAYRVAVVHFSDREGNRLFTSDGSAALLADDVRDLGALADDIGCDHWLESQGGDARMARCLHLAGVSAHAPALLQGICLNANRIGLTVLIYEGSAVLQGDAEHAVRSLTDRLAVATAKLEAEASLRYQAYHDLLTGLPNRALLRDRAEQAMERALRSGARIGLLLADLDRFKEINDSLGHAAGDVLLQTCAQRLRNELRASDTVARPGGDEFVVLLPDMEGDGAVQRIRDIAVRLNESLSQPIRIQGHDVTTQASTGIALYPDNAENFDELLKMADAAMYEAKRDPRVRLRWYSQSMDESVNERFELAQALRVAIDADELFLCFQPKVTYDGRIAGVEALVRWRSPTRGIVLPKVFIPVLESIGLGDRFGEWVMDRTCAQMAEWDRQGLPPVAVAMNLSTQQLMDVDLCGKLRAALQRHDMTPDRLEIEILESAAIVQAPVVSDNLRGMRDLGVSLALDDFGTGYSSLSYLLDLPVGTLKLDRSFILRLQEDARQQAVVERIISLAKVLNFAVVAEGVEYEEQVDMLKDMGCDLFQGIFFSIPVPADKFAALLLDADLKAI